MAVGEAVALAESCPKKPLAPRPRFVTKRGSSQINVNLLLDMKTKSPSWIMACFLAGTVAFVPAPGLAADKKMDGPKPDAPAAERRTPAQRAIPFRGKLTALDKSAQTITVGARVFQVTSETKILKGADPGTLQDGSVGATVSGSYHEVGGKLVAKLVRFGAKADGESPKPKPEPESGKKKKTG